MKKRKVDPWFPFWIDKWLFGSTRIELTPAERGVFVDLMSLSKKDDGYIRANEGVPYLDSQLCGLLNITTELYHRTVEKCIKHGKTKKLKDGTLYMTSHDVYKLSDRQERRVEKENFSEKILTEKIIKELDSYSPPIQHESQKLLKNGRVDIFIPEPYLAIIELKNNSGADNIQRAIGQLLIYKNEYPEAMLFIATPERMHKKTLDKIAMFKIQQWDLKSMISKIDVRIPDATTKKEDTNIILKGKKNRINNKDIHKEIRHEVINYLNEKTGKNFDIDSDNVIGLINGRLSDKKPATLEEMKFVIDVKVTQWLNDPENNKYLRPSTLFRKSNFENYRNEILPKKRPQVGENIHETTKREIKYNEARRKKLFEIDKELADEVEEAKKAGNIHRLEGLENTRKEKIAEFSQEYSAKEKT